MKKIMLAVLATLFFGVTTVSAQGLIKKLKQKAAEAAEKIVDKKTDEAIYGKGNSQSGAGNVAGTAGQAGGGKVYGKNPSNTSGGGLVAAAPDINENLGNADASFKAGSYSDARYAIQQAMIGVEMKIGDKLLTSLPETVAGLPIEKEADQVTSTGFGWAGLTIHREYLKDDKQFSITIANNALLLSAINMYLANSGYAQTTNGEQQWKRIQVKGNKAVIEYDENSGYKISVPLGQSSMVLFEGVNFKSEQEMTSAANQIDIDKIKNTLGEN
ncbi:MAG TPA: hypothetical protein VGE26_08665 [Sphingobacteriaceae bacterium]